MRTFHVFKKKQRERKGVDIAQGNMKEKVVSDAHAKSDMARG